MCTVCLPQRNCHFLLVLAAPIDKGGMSLTASHGKEIDLLFTVF